MSLEKYILRTLNALDERRWTLVDFGEPSESCFYVQNYARNKLINIGIGAAFGLPLCHFFVADDTFTHNFIYGLNQHWRHFKTFFDLPLHMHDQLSLVLKEIVSTDAGNPRRKIRPKKSKLGKVKEQNHEAESYNNRSIRQKPST